MRKAARKEVGDTATFTIAYDPADGNITMHPKLQTALTPKKSESSI